MTDTPDAAKAKQVKWTLTDWSTKIEVRPWNDEGHFEEVPHPIEIIRVGGEPESGMLFSAPAARELAEYLIAAATVVEGDEK